MKMLRSLSVFLAAILLLTGCEKEKPPVDKEFTPDHWPIVKTLGATPLTSSTAKLTGTVNACGLSTTVTFEYGTTTSYGKSVTANQSPITGDIITNINADISGLILGTTYHFRVKAENSLWKNFYGRDMVFTIHSPKVETLEVTNITETTATLNGTVNTYGLSTPITFEYGTTTSYGSTITVDQSPVTGNSITNVSADISGLTPCTTYHFRVKAENSCGVVYGSDIEFLNDNLPIVTTLEATNLEPTSTRLNGTVNPNGLSTTVTFEYGTTTSYGSTAAANESLVTGNSITNVSADISGLTPCTTFHFRVKAENSCGIVYGSDKTFICPGTPTWTTYTTADGLVSNYVISIAIDAQGNKWFGTSGGGVSKFDGTIWTNYTTSDGLASNYVSVIAIDAQGNKWFGTEGGGVSKFDGTTWTTYTSTNGLELTNVSAIGIDAQGNKWFGAAGGVSKFDGTTWTRYEGGGLIEAITIDAQCNIWVVSPGCLGALSPSSLSKFDGINWTVYTSNNLYCYWPHAITIDAQGNKWIGTDGGIIKFDGTNWTNYTTADGLANNDVLAIAIDAQGNKWFGTTGGGVSKFDGTNWTTFTTANGLVNNYVNAIAIDAQGNKWFGTSGGVSKLSDTCNE